jgi:hypothetical protein
VCDAAAKPRYLTAAELERIAGAVVCEESMRAVARELGRDHSSVLRAARSERVGRLVKEIRRRGGDAQRQAAKRARDAERACLAELEAQAAGPQVAAAIEPHGESARQRQEHVEQGFDRDGGRSILLPNGRRIGYWPDDRPAELARARRLIVDAGFDPNEYGL